MSLCVECGQRVLAGKRCVEHQRTFMAKRKHPPLCVCGRKLVSNRRYYIGKCYTCVPVRAHKPVLCSCGKELSERQRCFDCIPKRGYKKTTQFATKPKLPDVEVTCAHCDKVFPMRPQAYGRRLSQSRSGKLYCSKGCSGMGGHSKNSGAPLKRRAGQSDEEFYWETLLHNEGLGVEVGGSRYLIYGYQENLDNETMRRASQRRGKTR